MKILYLQCNMGAAGDMLTASLASLLPDPNVYLDTINGMGLEGVKTTLVRSASKGMAGLHAHVVINGIEEETLLAQPPAHHAAEDHLHHHHHSHSSLADVLSIIDKLRVPEDVRKDAAAVYQRIAEAEAAAHGAAPGEIHFHEVGMKDAISDIVSVCLLIRMLGAEKIVCSPVCVGSGLTYTSHGFLPIPTPATAKLLEGIPSYGSKFPGELCTPTGAALIAYFADEFGAMPAMTPIASGCGIGAKEFSEPNCLRSVLGESSEKGDSVTDDVAELSANIDDMTAEDLSFARDILLENGALDAWLTPIIMKKGRAATMLSCLCHAEDLDRIQALIFRHTSTLGIRFEVRHRVMLKRSFSEVSAPAGTIHLKRASGMGISRAKPEFDDLAAAARRLGISLREVRELLKADKEK